MSRLAADLRQLRSSPGYPKLLSGATVARLAHEMTPLAIVLLVLERTDDPWLAGATAAAFTLPSVVTGPLAGAALDRAARPNRLLIADQLVAAAALALVAAGAGSVPDLAVLAAGLAAGATLPLSTGGVTALIPDYAGREQSASANALEAVSYNTAAIGGPLTAGAIVAAASPLAAVLVQIALRLTAFVALAALPALPAGRSRLGVLVSVRAGWSHIGRTPELLAVTAASAVSFGARGLLVLAFPFFAVEALGLRESAAGWLWAAFAAGAVLGALLLAAYRPRWSAERMALGAPALGGLVMLAWPLAGSLAVALALVALAGVAFGPGLAAQITLRQERTPRAIQGQVVITAASVKLGAFALGAAVAGPVAEGLGGSGALVLAGAGQLVAFVLGAALIRRGGGAAAAAEGRAGTLPAR